MRYTDRLFELFKQVIIFYKEYNKNICVYIYLTEPLKDLWNHVYFVLLLVAVPVRSIGRAPENRRKCIFLYTDIPSCLDRTKYVTHLIYNISLILFIYLLFSVYKNMHFLRFSGARPILLTGTATDCVICTKEQITHVLLKRRYPI
jgi:hypothetical protein